MSKKHKFTNKPSNFVQYLKDNALYIFFIFAWAFIAHNMNDFNRSLDHCEQLYRQVEKNEAILKQEINGLYQQIYNTDEVDYE